MAYSAITDAEIAVGGPVQNPTLVKLQGNDSYFNTQLTALQSATQNPEPLTFSVKGEMGLYVPQTAMAYQRIWTNLTLTAGRLLIITAGSAGTTQVDVQLKRGGGAFATIFTTKPSSPYTDGDYFLTSNGVLSTTALLSGDILRLDCGSAQTGSHEFQLLLPFTFT